MVSFTALFVLKGQVFVGLALFLAKIVGTVSFTGLAHIILGVKLVRGLIWDVTPGHTSYRDARLRICIFL